MKYKKILILGSGALKIGEAGEFDYSGSQAIKALKEEGIEIILINPNIDTIILTEDRQMFADKLRSIDVSTAESMATTSVDEALIAAEQIGYPVIVRAAFTLGGQGSGFCYSPDDLKKLANTAFSFSSQLLVEKSLKGWKEVEYEVVRDKYDNCITVCNMENFDPLGIHTGESIVVAPSQTLSNTEYHKLREISIKIIRAVGVVGECNVQFALDPKSECYRVIEVNARLSRSSALASKTTSAFFEPALDYVVVKIPRWDLGKFDGVSHLLGSSMKSVGEIIAIGRSFEECIQKGLRIIGQGMHGFTANKDLKIDNLEESLQNPTDERIFSIAIALKQGYSVEKINELTGIDRWFIEKLHNILRIENDLAVFNSIESLSIDKLRQAKKAGFSDFQLARILLKSSDESIKDDMLQIREYRKSRGIVPVVKQIDTLAAEYPAQTNYLYLTYHGSSHDIEYQNNNNAIIVLGSGAYRIGSSVEFDWGSVNALNEIRKQNYEAVMINYNPETVSTDYDVCDRLYFDELSLERVLDIEDLEKSRGIIVSVGGQIPNTLALRLHKLNVHILGTSAVSIDRAEDRHKFSSMLDALGIDQPKWQELSSISDINRFADEIGFPLLIRPSYVLSGAAMNVVSNKIEMEHFLTLATSVSKKHPVVVSHFIENAKEIEYDAVAEYGEIKLYAISEHIEFAGVHSGDATLVFPPQKIYFETIRRIKRIARQIAKELQISGPFNMQFLAKNNEVKVIECNLRASRSFPFVSKVLGENFIEAATKVMLRIPITKPPKSIFDIDHIGIKASQFSFSRLTKADPVLGVDMSSTGEVGCIGTDMNDTILKAMLSVGYTIPKKAVLLSSGDTRSKVELINPSRLLIQRGLKLYATQGTHDFLKKNDILSEVLHWPDD